MPETAVPVIIPALNPDEKLTALIDGLFSLGLGNIVIVNDGSTAGTAHIFERAQNKGCTVLTHAENLGKGAALKTAFAHFLATQPGIVGCITADADGQHAPKDILTMAGTLIQNPAALIIGCRNFAQMPPRSRFGNTVTRFVMQLFCGVHVSDTQTGLRAIPAAFMQVLLNVPGQRYEFETNMLIETKPAGFSIEEVPISTIYIGSNETSHFHPLKDSVRIYRIFLKFILSSLSSSLVDLLLFTLLVHILKPTGNPGYIFIATAIARVCSAVFNYGVNSKIVFEKNIRSGTAVKYFCLAFLQMLCSAFLVHWVVSLFFGGEIFVKAIVDIILFILSYQIQNRFIFI